VAALGLISDLLKDRYIGAINKWLDSHASGPIYNAASWVANRPFILTLLGLTIFALILVVHAVVVSRNPKHPNASEALENPTELLNTSKASAPLSGSADLLVTRLELHDIYLDKTGEMAVNQGIFVRLLIASSVRPRTVKKFEIEVRTMINGIAQSDKVYRADSEREIGEYRHRYSKSTIGSLGYVVEQTVEDPMPDLLKMLRTPLLPDTHVEGWVRFEVKEMKHELDGCHITIYAVDATDNRYEIEAADMRVVKVDSHEYAVARDKGSSLL
jgi:hypothetical protein